MFRLVFPALLLIGSTALSLTAQAQTTTPGSQQSVRVSLKDGAFRRRGVVMRIQNGKINRLTAPFTLANGTVISPDGQIVTPDGTRKQLLDGRAVNMQGEIVGLSDDMLTAATIQQLDEAVTGYTGTVITGVPNPVSANDAATLARLERKATMVQQLANRLAERTALAVPTSDEATKLDERLKVLDMQLTP